MTIILLIAVWVCGCAAGLIVGKATARKKVFFYERGINEIGRFARQQSAIGDPSATVISDMVENIHNNKEAI